MGTTTSQLAGPNLAEGVTAQELKAQGRILGHFEGEAVLLVQHGEEVHAISSVCTHYSGPLQDGIVRGDTIHCPWHHACFDLRTGAPSAPALTPLTCFQVVRDGERLRVNGKLTPPRPAVAEGPASVLILGAGAAGHAAAEALRSVGYEKPVTMVGMEASGPVDRPNLSKDYLAGQAPLEWMPLRPPEFFQDHKIALDTSRQAVEIRPQEKQVVFSDGARVEYGTLLIATGASPIRLALPGGDGANVHYLRTLEDADKIIAAAQSARRAVVVGSSFIGLEVAASLRTRGLEVAVVGPESVPLEKVLGKQIGEAIRKLHEAHGVVFHLGRKPAAIDTASVTLDDGTRLESDFVVIGVGVRPNTELAEKAGLRVENGIVVDAFLETSQPGIFAAGDCARWPSPLGEGTIRIEHWTVAQRQGQAAARNILGDKRPYRTMPFFWSAHYDKMIRYVGVGAGYTDVAIAGSLESGQWLAVYRKGERVVAVASLGRDRENLQAEEALENDDQAFLRSLVS